MLIIVSFTTGLSSPNLPFLLLSDVLDSVTLDLCDPLFTFVEERVSTWTKASHLRQHGIVLQNIEIRSLSIGRVSLVEKNSGSGQFKWKGPRGAGTFSRYNSKSSRFGPPEWENLVAPISMCTFILARTSSKNLSVPFNS